MAHAYTPGLTVAPRTSVAKRRLLPLKGEVLVEEGQRVQADTVVARAELPGDVHPVNVTGRLGVRPEEVPEYMLKEEGDKVEKDEPLAETQPWIKLLKTVCYSPITGEVENISPVTGQVLLREPPRRIELSAYVAGTVIEVLPEEGAVVETPASMVQGIFGVGGETGGKLIVPVGGADENMAADQLDDSCEGCVVVCGAGITADLVEAAREAGVHGLVGGGMLASELSHILGYDIGVAVTGSEDIGLTLIITEGFGHIPMAQATFELLQSLEGRRASINGATQIRAGVVRPEVIVPLERDEAKEKEVISTEADGLQEGDRVRIIREPYFGRIGEVDELVPELVKIETEAGVRVLRLTTLDGQELTVPRANVEVITR